jgi:hypothetical protein
MGASGWVTVVPWREVPADALRDAREKAYALVDAKSRREVETLSDEELLRRIELDPEEDEENYEAWRRWLAAAPKESRYALARSPAGGTGTILDVDTISERETSRAQREALPTGEELLMLVTPAPGLLSARWATAEELIAWFETERPAEVGEAGLDALERNEVVAFVLWQGDQPREIAFLGVTGD